MERGGYDPAPNFSFVDATFKHLLDLTNRPVSRPTQKNFVKKLDQNPQVCLPQVSVRCQDLNFFEKSLVGQFTGL
jgi:hypothetical protein